MVIHIAPRKTDYIQRTCSCTQPGSYMASPSTTSNQHPRRIFLIRHATPDWTRTDIPYDIPPGPSLSLKGEMEAAALADFVRGQGVVKLYHSPFERAARTARVISVRNGIPRVEDARLAEWREETERGAQVQERMAAVFALAIKESATLGPIALVTHAGPVTFLLQELAIDPTELAEYQNMFDNPNPLPPAGAWMVEPGSGPNYWNLSLEFIPKVS
jgi:broad specificity phosphatase PhoE